jgi:hypothetical protein
VTPDGLVVALVIYMDETFGDVVEERLSYLRRIEDALLDLIDDEERKNA